MVRGPQAPKGLARSKGAPRSEAKRRARQGLKGRHRVAQGIALGWHSSPLRGSGFAPSIACVKLEFRYVGPERGATIVATSAKLQGRGVPQTGAAVNRLAEAEVVPPVRTAGGVHMRSVLNLVRPVRTCGWGEEGSCG